MIKVTGAVVVLLALVLPAPALGGSCAWCLEENAVDWKRSRDYCTGDYYADRGDCWGEDAEDLRECKRDATTDRRECLAWERETKRELDRWCRREVCR